MLSVRRAAWLTRLSCVTGNLGEPHLGLQQDVWQRLAKEVSVVIHNGALVHWVYLYSNLKPANVQGTLEILALCDAGTPKQLTFVSSTSVLDTFSYLPNQSNLVAVASQLKMTFREAQPVWAQDMGNPNGYQNTWSAKLAHVASEEPLCDQATSWVTRNLG
jgi:thioester reductase-like protein